MKYYNMYSFLICFVLSIYLTIGFFIPCNGGHEIHLYCKFPVGFEAVVNQSAEINIFGTGDYIVEQHNQDGTIIIHESRNDDVIRVSTDQPTTWLMVKAPHGIFHEPGILVARTLADQNPSLFVHRTIHKVAEQILYWNLLFPLLVNVFFSVYFYKSFIRNIK
jgi:hypothetical protein